MSKNILSRFADTQMEKWKKVGGDRFEKDLGYLPVITLSSEAGSGGSVVAEKLAEAIGFAYFNRELIEVVAKSAEVNPAVLEHMEKERFSGLQDFFASLLDDKYLWPGVYLDHLKNMVDAIGRSGRAVIVGRGANFILSPEMRLCVRVVAPLGTRIENVMQKFDISRDEAKKRVLNRESRRSSFIKKSFNADIAQPDNYDLVVNTGALEIDAAVGIIGSAWSEKFCR